MSESDSSEAWWECSDCCENYRRARGRYPPGLPLHLSPNQIVTQPPFAEPPPTREPTMTGKELDRIERRAKRAVRWPWWHKRRQRNDRLALVKETRRLRRELP